MSGIIFGFEIAAGVMAFVFCLWFIKKHWTLLLKLALVGACAWAIFGSDSIARHWIMFSGIMLYLALLIAIEEWGEKPIVLPNGEKPFVLPDSESAQERHRRLVEWSRKAYEKP